MTQFGHASVAFVLTVIFVYLFRNFLFDEREAKRWQKFLDEKFFK